jgi:peptidoglycan/xylan/chitin deacetylase (PgdA/CDA1 family)
MEYRLKVYARLAEQFDTTVTLPVTACVLARHSTLMRRLARRHVELAVHGLVHNDHAVLSYERQYESIAKAAETFRSRGIPFAGFRSPFLRANEATNRAVRELGFRYHSTQAVVFPVIPAQPAGQHPPVSFLNALRLYNPLDAAHVAVRPRDRAGCIDLPVSLPDDDMLVDRLAYAADQQSRVWLDILDFTYRRGDLFTLQLHPERVLVMERTLRAVLEEARSRVPRVWIAGLGELASWWERRKRAHLQVLELAPGRYRITLAGDDDLGLLIRGLPAVQASPWRDRDLLADVSNFEVAADTMPVVGVSPRTVPSARAFLAEEGFPIEISDAPARFTSYVDLPEPGFDEIALLEELDRARGPIVRLWRWPRGIQSALAVTGDIDAITLQDFILRMWESRS